MISFIVYNIWYPLKHWQWLVVFSEPLLLLIMLLLITNACSFPTFFTYSLSSSQGKYNHPRHRGGSEPLEVRPRGSQASCILNTWHHSEKTSALVGLYTCVLTHPCVTPGLFLQKPRPGQAVGFMQSLLRRHWDSQTTDRALAWLINRLIKLHFPLWTSTSEFSASFKEPAFLRD